MNVPQIIAFYLPQYHEIPENNEWWGKGFTEWTNVKKAQPLFKKHNQPRIPYHNNYYNLDDVDVMRKQSELAKKYGVDAFCFYHYWFNGKKLLEKPVENYFDNKDIETQFCFSWANEPWTRAWDGGEQHILMPQSYSGKDDIVNHFNYLLPFFLDSRYIKINNKPIFILYRANSITYLTDMIDIWNEKIKEYGFSGIHFIETLNTYQLEKYSDRTDACLYFEPMYSLRKESKLKIFISMLHDIYNRNRRVDYKYLWRKVIKNESADRNCYLGGFVDWDNSPRKKKNNLVLTHVDVSVFEKYFGMQYRRALENNAEFLFINAWNEWAEGTYLEPDEKREYSFLEIIKRIRTSIYPLSE